MNQSDCISGYPPVQLVSTAAVVEVCVIHWNRSCGRSAHVIRTARMRSRGMEVDLAS